MIYSDNIWDVILPIDELHDFSEGLKHTTKQIYFPSDQNTSKHLSWLRFLGSQCLVVTFLVLALWG